mmetsp:Transcript_8926/g.17274  ORF Transcript_8926/g.17274 Transcript_8926/m.17274 type:complete len:96 (-) Transcript_8926:195-482(-)
MTVTMTLKRTTMLWEAVAGLMSPCEPYPVGMSSTVVVSIRGCWNGRPIVRRASDRFFFPLFLKFDQRKANRSSNSNSTNTNTESSDDRISRQERP